MLLILLFIYNCLILTSVIILDRQLIVQQCKINKHTQRNAHRGN